MPNLPAADPARDLLDLRAVRRNFSRAAVSADAHAVLQREVAARMAERLGVVRLEPRALVDAGCGTGDALAELGVRYPGARRIGVDFALPMLEQAQRREKRLPGTRGLARWLRPRAAAGPHWICAAIESLPLPAASVDLVWSNLTLHWLNQPDRALAELGRVLRVDGLLTFSTLGPDTLQELREAFAATGGGERVHPFIDLHDWGDMLVASGFADPVMDMERITLTYPDAGAMLRELKALGAVNALHARQRGLTGRVGWERAMNALARMQRDDKLPATFEIVYGHAWKPQPRVASDGRAIVRFGARPPR
jgi:malonyl-CoA O-methyltransferase